MSSGFAKSNTIHSKKRKTTIAKHASSRGRFDALQTTNSVIYRIFYNPDIMNMSGLCFVLNIIQNGLKFPESHPWEDDFEWEATEMDSYLAGHMSGLSFNESEDDEAFLFLS